MAENKRIDTAQVIKYLSVAFSKACQKKFPSEFGKVTKDSSLYPYQVEFCYLIDDIQRGPEYFVSRVITDANNLIERVNKA